MREYVRIVESFMIVEGSVDRVLKTFGPKLVQRYKEDMDLDRPADGIVSSLTKVDPTPTKDYILWLASRYTKKFNDEYGIKRWEDIPSTCRDALIMFDKLKKSKTLPVEEREINKYRSLGELLDVVDRYKEELKTNITQEELLNNGEAKLIYNDSSIKVVVPLTEKASCFFGINTRWCTAAQNQNMFDHYNDQGPLYIIVIKKENKRFQFHFEQNQYMNERDEEIDPRKLADEYPKLWDIFASISEKAGTLILVKNPSEELQLETIDNDWRMLRFIDHPSDNVQLTAVKRNGFAIQYIKSPSEEVQKAALKTSPPFYVMRYIKDLSEDMQMYVVKLDPQLIEKIMHPIEEAQLYAVRKDGMLLDRIMGVISHRVKQAAVKNKGAVIQLIQNQTEDLQILAVENNAYAIRYIKDPCVEAQIITVKKDPQLIRFIKVPCIEAERIARS